MRSSINKFATEFPWGCHLNPASENFPLISRQFNLLPLGNQILDAGSPGYLWKTKITHKPMVRTGREHLAWMVVVEVRQGTLGVAGRG